nr:MAG TPA: hypothetical protein [Caudoviricetes sp.]
MTRLQHRYALHACYSYNAWTYAIYMRIYTNIPRDFTRPTRLT